MTKICLISTTIYVPEVLRLYRAAGPDVTIIITGDRKTPHDEVYALARELGNTLYLSDTDQEALGYECSEVIGWNCIMRRSIALLEAIKLKPDIIITIDDDNIPMDPGWYFDAFSSIIMGYYSGLSAKGKGGWFNVGDLFTPPIMHRGFPAMRAPHGNEMSYAVDAEIGVVAGLWYGDPDIGAIERIGKGPEVLTMADLLQDGIVVEPGVYAPFNSQNTGYTYELAPLMAILPAIGRADDIWAAYIAERVMRETGQRVFYGPPFTWQERNAQSLHKNLNDEMYGMLYAAQFCRDLDAMKLGGGTIVDMLGRLWEQAQTLEYLPQRLRDFGLAWMRDLKRVMV